MFKMQQANNTDKQKVEVKLNYYLPREEEQPNDKENHKYLLLENNPSKNVIVKKMEIIDDNVHYDLPNNNYQTENMNLWDLYDHTAYRPYDSVVVEHQVNYNNYYYDWYNSPQHHNYSYPSNNYQVVHSIPSQMYENAYHNHVYQQQQVDRLVCPNEVQSAYNKRTYEMCKLINSIVKINLINFYNLIDLFQNFR